jgi:hypothetical protein
MNGNCGVCGRKGTHICPEHGERCNEHVLTHAFCPQLRPMCISCGALVYKGGKEGPELCTRCCQPQPTFRPVEFPEEISCNECGVDVGEPCVGPHPNGSAVDKLAVVATEARREAGTEGSTKCLCPDGYWAFSCPVYHHDLFTRQRDWVEAKARRT